jgi:5-methyltetrahydropteroyltriglutamate--homocysteine methyltransferase
MEKAASLIRKIIEITGTERVMVSSSCSLMHVPVDVNCENDLDSEIRPWLSFAVQKCGEIRTIADAVSGDAEACRKALKSKGLVESRKKSAILNNKIVRDRTNNISAGMLQRKSLYSIRRLKQKNKLNLPPFPTTTIGSFPQTAAIRKARKNFKNGVIDSAEYDRVIREYITDSIRRQESIGLDVLVHGEPERNDMVEYFGEMMDGVCITGNGWVQSYGTRCVKPPVIFGDVSRKKPWTKDYTNFAQSLTGKPVKGILTGPVTILSWSFVRDDQPRRITCTQIALAIRDEVLCLEESGAPIIQIDEPAFREDSPLRKIDRQEYYEWASACFRLASSGVKDETQIHTHMCYCEFNDAIEEIASLDADVISIEASRSNMDILIPLTAFGYPNEIGPGVYDIHSPRVPGIGEIAVLIKKASEKIPQERLWINPDCGLKTRKWEEAEPALRNMVEAARLACSI